MQCFESAFARCCAVIFAVAAGFASAVASAADMSSVATLPKPGVEGAAWTEGQIVALRRDIDGCLRSSTALAGAHVGLYAVDTRTGTPLYSRNVDDDFTPASNEKIITGSAALVRLGRGFRFRTALFARTQPHDGAIAGDLIVRGGGDALLRVSDLYAAAAALAARGVRSVEGGILADTSHFDEQRYGNGWVIDDLPYDYAAPINALSLEDNAVHLTVTPARLPGDPAVITATPISVGYALRNAVTTGTQGSPQTVTPEWRGDGTISLVGSIPLGASPIAIDAAVPDPPAYALAVFRRALSDHGITVEGKDGRGIAPTGAAMLWTHDSEPLERLLADLWYPSDNVIAEMLFKEVGVEAETAFLRSAGIDTATVALFDGSGLSRYNQLTPRALVAVLQYDFRSPYRDTVLDALPVAGVRGTLKGHFVGTPAQGRVFAKTGGMLNVTNLSGYTATKHHGSVTFSFLIDNALGEDAPIAATRAGIFSRFIDAR